MTAPWFAAALAAILLMASSSPVRADDGPIVQAPAGAAQGQIEDGVRVFKGLPYAMPPTGSARWTPPRAAADWQGLRKASQFGPACLQPFPMPRSIYTDVPGRMDEDCLYLNVWTPADARNAPVIVWVHGGAFTSGMGHEAIYDGAKFARQGVIVVSINYRLGVLGYLANPELSAESALGVSGNYGLMDQIEALRWVRRNIAAFGGDPANVTIAGESAGGLSVAYLMISPQARGLFAKAIAESAYLISTPDLKAARFGQSSAEATGMILAAKMGARRIADLRNLDGRVLTNTAAALGFSPAGVIDGKVLPRQLVEAFDAGAQAPVPLLAGFNSGEIRSLRALAPKLPASAALYESQIRARYGDLADAYLRLYPSDKLEESIIQATRDALYGWTAERLAVKQTALGQPAYLYLFDHGYPAADSAGLHAFHGSELPFVFGTYDRLPPYWPKPPMDARQSALSNAMVGYWTSFARTGVPRASGEPPWPAFGTAGAYMAFEEAPHPGVDLLPGMYALNEAVVCRRRAEQNTPWNWNIGLLSPPIPAEAAGCR
jgi:para-nitrobenzyl esterase